MVHCRGHPCVLENPCCSLLWWAPPLKPLLSIAQSINTDYCQHGTPWRKRTRFSMWNCACAEHLSLLCSSRGGICSRTGKPHVKLEGWDKVRKVRRTKLAEPYPKPLCKKFWDLVCASADDAAIHCRTALVGA